MATGREWRVIEVPIPVTDVNGKIIRIIHTEIRQEIVPTLYAVKRATNVTRTPSPKSLREQLLGRKPKEKKPPSHETRLAKAGERIKSTTPLLKKLQRAMKGN
jgi:hypothetical protein